jgi:tetratricopeptide (TPR) repeat protein
MRFLPSGGSRHRYKTLFTLMLLVMVSYRVMAQAAAIDVPAPVPQAEAAPEVDPAYLEPLKALSGDENAFVDQLWTMGNGEFERIETLESELAEGRIASEMKAKHDEIRLCVARLKAIAALGLKTFDHNARVHNFNGTVYYDALGQPLDGVKEWLAAVSLDSKYSDPYNNLGMHYFHTGNYTLGFQNMDRAMELEPKNADYCFNMVQNYLNFYPQAQEYRGWDAKRVYKEAMKLSKKATKLAPDDFEILQDYAVNFLWITNLKEEPDWKASIKAWREARRHAPKKVNVYFTWLNEGRAWRSLGNKEEAKRCFETALHNLPEGEEDFTTKRLLQEVSE